MKLILSLILIISIALNCANAFNHHNYNRNVNEKSNQQCFTNGELSNGYSSDFIVLAFDANVVTPNGLAQTSFYESGQIDIDFKNQQMYLNYIIDYGGQKVLGRVWTFAQNNTEYFVPSINGVETCYSGPVQFEIPSSISIKYVGDIDIGTIDCEVFEPSKSILNNTLQSVVVNKNDCSITSANTYNYGPVSGYSMTNFYNYEAQSNPANLQLPSACSNPISSKSLSSKFVRSKYFPKSSQFLVL